MARKLRKNGKKETASKNAGSSHQNEDSLDTQKSIGAVLAFIGAILFVLSYLGKGGGVGYYISYAFTFLLGNGYFFAPLTLLLIGFSFLFVPGREAPRTTLLGGLLFLLSTLASFHILFGSGSGGFSSGGFIGRAIGAPLLRLFDFWASIIIALGGLLISLLLISRISLSSLFERRIKENEEPDENPEEPGDYAPAQNPPAPLVPIPAPEPQTVTLAASENPPIPIVEKAAEGIALRKIVKAFHYRKPPLDLLQGDRGTPSSGDIRAVANTIKRTLENFGITVEMGEVSIGPTVTQYTLKPAEGIKLSRIVALHNDLSLALASHPIRIEAPIPGRSLVGLEVPNRGVSLVGLRSLLEHQIFQETNYPLLFALGRDVTGMPVFADLARMPHLMISGATGSGKSVAIHTLTTSLLYRNPPGILRFIMVDPKRVELSVYNDIPHLLTPVINDPQKTIQALRWATKEMDRRYDFLSLSHTRDISSYNAKAAKSEKIEPLPYLIIIIDELADLMAAFPREVESSIIRLAQMARAVGIHLVVATQRPSVEVLTGLIKANITSRIACQVASQVDSRTILDMAGAEKLLGNGDMLFLAGDTAKPRRIQGVFVSEQEVKRVVEFLREAGETPTYEDEIFEPRGEDGNYTGNDFASEGEDPLYTEAHAVVVEAGRASASYLQRRLRIGYARAARLLDVLEERGIVGPADGAKPREVRVKPDDS